MVYDDYADIGIFAKWVMDAPEIGHLYLISMMVILLFGKQRPVHWLTVAK